MPEGVAEKPDAALLEEFRAGDRAAFEVLVRRYQRPVLGVARRFCDDQDDAEDVAQRAFINAAQREPLDVLSRAGMGGLSGEELEDYTQARMVWNANLPTVRTTQLDLAYGIIEQVMASGYRDGERLRGSVVIDAAPALRKTTIATRYARDFHRRTYRREGPETPEGHQRLPVAFIPLSAGITLKGLNQKLLQFFGHPGAERATTSLLASLAVDCVVSWNDSSRSENSGCSKTVMLPRLR